MSRNRLSGLAKHETLDAARSYQLKAAVIRTTATDVSDALYVTITADSPTRLRGPYIGWQRRGTTLPSVGDPCAVAQLDDTTTIIVNWWPADGSGGT